MPTRICLFNPPYAFFVFPLVYMVLEMGCLIIKTTNSNSQRVFLGGGCLLLMRVFVIGVVTVPCHSSFTCSVIDGK